MRYTIPTFFICLGLLAGCHKNDVDVEDLNTNPFDADYPGESTVITVDPIQTLTYGQGTLHKQTVVVHVHPEQFPASTPYSLRFIELTDPDTSMFYSSNEPDNTFNCANFQVTLGTEYCYRIELVVEGETAITKELCGVAQL